MLDEQRSELTPIVHARMVVFLAVNVGLDARKIRLAHRECGVARLPLEMIQRGAFRLDPFRARLLDLLDDLNERIVF